MWPQAGGSPSVEEWGLDCIAEFVLCLPSPEDPLTFHHRGFTVATEDSPGKPFSLRTQACGYWDANRSSILLDVLFSICTGAEA